MVGVKVQVPAVQVAVPFWVLAPVIATETVALSPVAVPQVPPTVVTVALLMYGNVRVVPFTVVSVTTGVVLSTVIDCAPLVPTLLAVSVCVAVTRTTPSAESAVVGVKVQAPAVQAAVPFCVLAPGDRDRHRRVDAGRGGARAADRRDRRVGREGERAGGAVDRRERDHRRRRC